MHTPAASASASHAVTDNTDNHDGVRPTELDSRRVLLSQFHAVALQQGYLFHPERVLTARERTAEGPSRCYHCHIELSLEKQSLGCTRCRYYVCRCVRRLCGYTGKNYLGQLFRSSLMTLFTPGPSYD